MEEITRSNTIFLYFFPFVFLSFFSLSSFYFLIHVFCVSFLFFLSFNPSFFLAAVPSYICVDHVYQNGSQYGCPMQMCSSRSGYDNITVLTDDTVYGSYSRVISSSLSCSAHIRTHSSFSAAANLSQGQC